MPVVYKGVQGSGQGDLFEGLKLWIAHRIPQRDRIIDLIKGNGGEIVKLEKNADMMIADHLKAGGVSPPPGSYSWKWVDTSVNNGFLEDKDDYLCGRRPGTSRDAGAMEKTKTGRTVFTPADDLVLTKWVLAEERMGGSIQGSAIYKDLENKHPRHTWQSWRNRWVKILSCQPRLDVSEEELQAEVEAHNAASPEPEPVHAAEPASAIQKSLPNRPAHTQLLSRAAGPRPGLSTSRRRSPGKGRMFFTQQEDHMLLTYIQNLKEKEGDPKLNGNVIYQDFAAEHPERTWHSWRDRWVRHLSLREAVDDAGPERATNGDPQEWPDRAKRQRPDQDIEVPSTVDPQESPRRAKRQRLNQDTKVSATVYPSSPAPGPAGTHQRRHSPQSAGAEITEEQQETIRARAATLIGSTWKSHAVRRDLKNFEAALIPLQARMRGFVARIQHAERRLAIIDDAGQVPVDDESEEDEEQFEDAREVLQDVDMKSTGSQVSVNVDPRDQFWADLDAIVNGSGIEIDKAPTVNGQEIDLWELYRSATEQPCEPEERDWKLVTERLGMEPVKSLVRKIQACYLQNLADFEDHIKAFENADGEDGEDSEEAGRDADAVASFQPTSDAVTAPRQPSAHPLSPGYRSSPSATRLEQSLEHTDLLRSDLALFSSGLRKRRRVDRNSVIPPTPEDKTGLPNGSHDRAAWDSSPLKQQSIANGQTMEMDEANELLEGHMESDDDSDELPSLSELPKKKFVEPETQDWHIELDTEDEDDASPSQQLQLDSDADQSASLAPHNRGMTVKDTKRRSAPALPLGGGSASVTRSHPQSTPIEAPATRSSRTPVHGKAPKRTLPAEYSRKSISPPATGPELPRNTTHLQRPPPSRATSAAQFSSTAPVRSANQSVPGRKLANANAASPAVRAHRNNASGFSAKTPPVSHTLSGKEAPKLLEKDFVEAEVQHFQAMGYKETHINEAMKAANMVRKYMVPALESLDLGRGIPQDVAGVWTAQDSVDLRAVKEYERRVEKGKAIAGQQEHYTAKVTAWRLRSRLEEKHGKKNMEERWSFMLLLGETDGA